MNRPELDQDLLMEQEQTWGILRCLNGSVVNPRTPGVILHEIGEHTFLEINGSMLSFDDLVKYRKVFIANNQYYVYLFAVSLCCVVSFRV